ncbi:MAG: hypothetical protein LAT50_13470 [Ectothiorhodospiraceae bacterium]|nr:hypothetical protein [Ectothiorhodospiraceae bacterium]
MAALGPREVEPDAWLRWLREAAGLLCSRPRPTAAWVAATLFLFYMSHRMSWAEFRYFSQFFLVGLGLMAFIRLAWCVDHNRTPRLWNVMPVNRDCVLALGLAAALFAMFVAFGGMLGPLAAAFREAVQAMGLWSPVTVEALPAIAPLRRSLLGPILVPGGTVGLALTACVALLLAFGQFFLLPMMVLHQPPLPPAMITSARAYPLNPVPMMGLSGVVMVLPALVVVSLGWLGALAVPYVGALMYVAYRDVFLGEEEEEPEEVEDEEPDRLPLRY